MAILESHMGYYLWHYIPSRVASILFIFLFGTATCLHVYKIYRTKMKFCTCFALGCLFELIGYIGRALAYNNTGGLMPYIIQSLFILIAPALFAASIYMTLGRIIRSVKAESYSFIKVSRLTKTFVIGDICSFLIQGGSAGLMINASTAKAGQAMVVTGLMVQIIMFGIFAVTAMIFQSRINRKPTPESEYTTIPWKQSLYMLYTVSALIMIRSIFRVIEYIMGADGYPLQHEWTLYIFDAVLMFLVTIIFYLKYPSQLEGKDTYSGELLGV